MPMTLVEQLKSAITPQFAGYAAKLLGETPANIEKAVSLAVPVLLSAIATALHVPTGQSGQSPVSRIVNDPVNDGSLLHRLPALYQGTMTASPVYRLGTQLLQAVFGAKLGKVTQTLAALSGIKPASSALLMNTLAPHVLSVIGKRHRLSGDATPQGLTNLLDVETAKLNAAIPSALGQLLAPPAPAATKTPPSTAAAAATVATLKAAQTSPAASAKTVKPAMESKTGKPGEQVIKPVVTKQSYKWGSWLPVIALYCAGIAGMIAYLSQSTEAPDTKTAATTLPSPVSTSPAPAPVATATPPKLAAPAAVTAATPAPSTVKPSDTAKPAAAPAVLPPSPPATLAAKPANDAAPKTSPTPPAKSAQAPSPTPEKPAAKPVAETAKPVAPVAAPAAPIAKGTTTYFGATPAPAEMAAKMNPDYKPATPAETPSAAATTPPAATPAPNPGQAPVAPAPAVTAPPAIVRGTTSYFGITPPSAEAPAKLNPDYKPAAPLTETVAARAPAAAPSPTPTAKAPAVTAAEQPKSPAPQGVTSYFGTAPAPAEQPALANPDYKPASPPVQEKSLAAAALAAVTNFITPAPPRPAGVTTYFGSTPANQEAAARPNPDYKPAVAAPAPAATVAAPASNPALSGAKPATSGDIAVCRAAVTKAVRGGRVIFQSAKADLKPASIATLDRLVAAFKSCTPAKLKVEGHTDNTGLASMNQTLSQARAQTVVDYLASKGIDRARITPVGLGSARPLAPNTTAGNKARNRRIEFTVDAP